MSSESCRGDVFSRGEASMYYEISGIGERPLLLLHGWGCGIENWLPVIRDFSPSRRVIAVDMPGFGKSPEPSDGWSVDDYAVFMLDFLSSLGVGEVDIIAHSFGGRIALKMSDLRPSLIRKQVLTGCAGLKPRPSKKARIKSGVFRALALVFDNALTRRVFGEERVTRARDKFRATFSSADYKNASPVMRRTFLRVIAQDLSDCLPKVRASTLLIWGDRDTATPLWMGKKMEEIIKDAGLVVFEGEGHFAYLTQYQRFITVCKKFLAD